MSAESSGNEDHVIISQDQTGSLPPKNAGVASTSETFAMISNQLNERADDLSSMNSNYNRNNDDKALFQIEAIVEDLSNLVINSQLLPINNVIMNRMQRNSSDNFSHYAVNLSRPMQRKLMNLVKCKLVYCPEAKFRLVKCIRSLAERTLTDLLLLHQNPMCFTKNLWIAVRNRGCQFLGPAMQEEVLRLILLALEDGSALSRKVLVLFVVQKLTPRYQRASKTNVGHVVQLLYRASCFKLQKREDDSSLMQLKEEFRNYDALRKEHDSQIIQIAMDACIKITPESWSSLLYGDLDHRSQMQSIIDRLQMNRSQSFSGMLRELQSALQRSGDPYELGKLLPNIDYIDRATREDALTIDNIPNMFILDILKKIQQMVILCSKVSSIFAINKQRMQQYSSVQEIRACDFTGSTNSLCSRQFADNACYVPNAKPNNMFRSWSSMSSVINPSESHESNTYNPNLHNNLSDKPIFLSPYTEVGFNNKYPTILANSLSNVANSLTVSNCNLNSNSTSNLHRPFNYSRDSIASPSDMSIQDEDISLMFSENSKNGVIWRDRVPSSGVLPISKLPPRVPIPNQRNFNRSLLEPKFPGRQWSSLNTIPSLSQNHYSSLSELNCTDDDRSEKDVEYQRLIRISNTIQDLEQQKKDLLSKLGQHGGYIALRNSAKPMNVLPDKIKSTECLLFNSESRREMASLVGFKSKNDTVIPFNQVPVHNKYGPISRSHRRLAQSLMTFPPLPESGDAGEDRAEDVHIENAYKLISQLYNDESSHNDDFNIVSMKHARSMPAIQDQLADETIQQEGNVDVRTSSNLNWLHMIDKPGDLSTNKLDLAKDFSKSEKRTIQKPTVIVHNNVEATSTSPIPAQNVPESNDNVNYIRSLKGFLNIAIIGLLILGFISAVSLSNGSISQLDDNCSNSGIEIDLCSSRNSYLVFSMFTIVFFIIIVIIKTIHNSVLSSINEAVTKFKLLIIVGVLGFIIFIVSCTQATAERKIIICNNMNTNRVRPGGPGASSFFGFLAVAAMVFFNWITFKE
ncbi:hypothetical protein GJ496_006275 [Pomphorhynchus laevis]|nr:hypothetical protein GJ496_006275 [Pomphorhynchus laevis]